MVLTRNKTTNFKDLKDHISYCLEGWNCHFLFKVEKVTLIKSISQAIPMYTIFIFRIPSGLCNDLDAFVWHFWWDSKPIANYLIALKDWKDICEPKYHGRLSFHRFKKISYVILEILDENLQLEWTSMLKAKYPKNKYFFKFKQIQMAFAGEAMYP